MNIEVIVFICVFFIVLSIILSILFRVFDNLSINLDKVKEHIKSGNHTLAIELLRNILSKKKSSDLERAKIHYMIGNCYYKMNEYPFAIVEYRHAMDAGFHKPELILSLGRALSFIGKKEEALSQFLYLLKIAPKYKDTISMEIGIIYYDNNQYETALRFFNNVLEADKTNKEALKYKAFCYVHIGNFIESIPILEALIRKEPDEPTLNYNLGLAFKGRNDYKNAIRHFMISAKDKQFSIKSFYEMGLAYFEINDIQNAIIALNTALEYRSLRKDLNLAILYKLVDCYDKQENINKAMETLENIIVIDSTYKDATKKLNEYKDAKYSDNIKKFFKLDENEFIDLSLKLVSCMNLIPYSLKTTDKNYVIVFARESNNINSNKKLIFFRLSYTPIFNEELIQLYDYALSYNILNSVLVTCAMASPDSIRYAAMSRIDIVGIKRLESLIEKTTLTNLPVGVTIGEEELDWV